MKKWLIFSSLLLTIGVFSAFTAVSNDAETLDEAINETPAAITWLTWDQMVAANKVKPKKVIIDVYTEWCGWCKHMDKTTFKDPKVVKYISDNFYAVKLDAEQKANIVHDGHTFKFVKQGRRGYHGLAAALLENKLSYPSIVYLNEKFQRILISPGFKKVDGMLLELEFTDKEIYNEKTWGDYKAHKTKANKK